MIRTQAAISAIALVQRMYTFGLITFDQLSEQLRHIEANRTWEVEYLIKTVQATQRMETLELHNEGKITQDQYYTLNGMAIMYEFDDYTALINEICGPTYARN